ncbi:siroheme decarboxylase subunit alpha [Persephonella sp.]
MNNLDKRILETLQEDIPIEREPFKKISEKLDINQTELLDRILELKNKKIIRQISPIYDTKVLGYESSLIAFKTDDIENVYPIVNSHPGVSHNYERNDRFNLWFTLAVPPDSHLGLERTVELLAKISNVDDYVILKTVKTYKIGVKLSFDTLYEKNKNIIFKDGKNKADLSELEKIIIKYSQEDIPLDIRPFDILSLKIGINVEELIEKLRKLKERGVMRRFSAILYHRKAGFKANGMTVWNVDNQKIDKVGRHFAEFKAVSHCYSRTTNEKWKYNLFTMIHGRSKQEIEDFVKNQSKELNLKDYKILYSTREFKKRRVKYFTDDIKNWEEAKLRGEYTGANI